MDIEFGVLWMSVLLRAVYAAAGKATQSLCSGAVFYMTRKDLAISGS